MIGWTAGDVSGAQVLTDSDHLYPEHVNELRAAFPTTATVDSSGSGQYTDIQTAISAVLAAGGGCVYIREGTYLISTAITLGNNLAIMGSGPATIVKLADSAEDHVFNNDGSVVTNFYIGNLTIDGNAANQTSTTACGLRGIFKKTVIENLYIHDTCAQAIAFVGGSNCSDFLIKGIIVDFTSPKASSEGIFVRGNRGAITNCSVFNTGDSGIILEEAESGVPSNNISVTNCTLGSCANYGIVYAQTVAGGYGISICNNTIKGSTNEGIITGLASDITISGNSVYGCVQGIMLADHTNGAAVVGNISSNNTQDGFLINGTSSNVVLSGNVSHNNGSAGLRISESAGSVIVNNNNIYSNTSSGVNVGSASSNIIFSGNMIHDNDGGAAGANGIDIGGGTDIVVTGNRFYNVGTAGQDYAIRSFENSDYISVTGNNTRGNSVGTISLVGSNNLIANNI